MIDPARRDVVIDTIDPRDPREHSLRGYAMFGYAMHLLGLFTVIGFIPFFILAQLWFAYRMIKGWLRVADRRAVS